MPISVAHIVEALSSIGGSGHLDEIVAKVVEIAPRPHPEDPGASIRARIQERCRGARSFKGGVDLFESVFGVDQRKGVWRLKSDPLAPGNHDSLLDGAEADIEAEEGRATLRIHLRRERSRKLIEAFKASLTNFSCEACGQDMEAVYGELGAGYIEAHHKVPVALIEEGEKTRLSDLAALCANCHRIIHRNGLMSVEALTAHIDRRPPRYAFAAEPEGARWAPSIPEGED
ncbi:HNH endonuclease [Brevundimonas sp.]|uniref:HNH endonuclease n=1 Tax=Brevundimonas sp. TaxID=1871086 RepID=UPI003D0CA81D